MQKYNNMFFNLLLGLYLFSGTIGYAQEYKNEPVMQEQSESQSSAHSGPTTQEIEIYKEVLAELDNNFKSVLDLDIELNYLVSYVNKAQLSPKILTHDNKIKINQVIKEMRSIANQTLRSQTIISSLGNIQIIRDVNYNIAVMCEAITKHIHATLDSKLTKINEFDFACLMKKSVTNNVTCEMIEQKITANKNAIKTLRKKTDTIGLTWYNKAARKFDDKIVTPWQKYGISKKLKIATITGIVGLIAAWEYGSSQTNLQFETFQKESMYTNEEQEIKNSILNNTLPADVLNDMCPASFKDDAGNADINRWLSISNGNTSDLGTRYLGQNVTKADIFAKEVLLYILRKRCKLNPYLEKLFKIFGHPLPKNKGYVDTDEVHRNTGKYGRFSHGMNFIHNVLSGHLPIVTLLGGYALANYKNIWNGGDSKTEKAGATSGIRGFLNIATKKMWNNLRGGLYKNQQIEGIFDFEPKFGFENVIGLEEAIDSLKPILDFFQNMEMNMNIGIRPEMGYLFTGKTRTGKTFLFEALCGEIVKILAQQGLNPSKFQIIPAEHVIQVGVKPILDWAKSQGPMVLFIDEIDLLNLHRVGNSNLLAEFLTALGNTFSNDPKKPVILITATNCPEKLDVALRQPGRLGKEIRFERPSLKVRIKALLNEFEKMAIDTSNFDIEILAQKTAGKSIEDIHAFVSAAVRYSWMCGEILTQELLERSIDSELRHILQIENKELSANEKRILSVHFAGSALAAHLLDLIEPLDLVTTQAIMTEHEEEVTLNLLGKNKNNSPKEKIVYGGLFTRQTCDTVNFKTYEQAINQIKVLIAGFVAEELLLGNCAYSCHSDNHKKALELAHQIIFAGLNKEQLSKDQLKDFANQAYALLKKCKDEVKELLSTNKKSLEALDKTLNQNKRLTFAEVGIVSDIAEGRIDIEALKAEWEAEKKKLQHPSQISSLVETQTSA